MQGHLLFTGNGKNDGEHFADHLRARRRSHLVEQHHVWTHGKGAGDHHALMLFSGRSGRVGVYPVPVFSASGRV